ncbi:MAG: hypothetical protein E6G64_13255 [Actinobacteria bacterium]|nr:MAG: hypothetical protein E6G64_13255 [Actinomycetota bacterium]
MSLLVLFDVDGTLLLTHDEIYVEANRNALQAVWGSAPDGPDVPGDTALAHTRRALQGAGFGDDEIDSGLDRWCAIFSNRYEQLLRDAYTSHWEAPQDAAHTLTQVEHRALLTGNPEKVARARLRRLDLDGLFPDNQGAFGCEREDRVELFPLARGRAGGWPAARTVAVGDAGRRRDRDRKPGRPSRSALLARLIPLPGDERRTTPADTDLGTARRSRRSRRLAAAAAGLVFLVLAGSAGAHSSSPPPPAARELARPLQAPAGRAPGDTPPRRIRERVVERLERLLAGNRKLEALPGHRVRHGHDQLARTSAPEQCDLQAGTRTPVQFLEETP